MRVALVTTDDLDPTGGGGGGARYALELAQALESLVDCRFLSIERAADAWSARRELRAADVVHVHQPATPAGGATVQVARLFGTPVVASDHGQGSGQRRMLTPWLVQRQLCTSAFAAATVFAPPGRTRVVYGGADPVRFQPDPTIERRGVVFVGRLLPHKGVDVAIRALPEGRSLTVVGPRIAHDGYLARLDDLARGKDVTFSGGVDRDAVACALRSAVVAVVPSVNHDCNGRYYARPELLGLAALEAMASGTPVVASSLGGLPEIIRDGETGFLVEPGDIGATNEALETLLADPARAARMGEAGRAAVIANFTWDACAARCVAAYREVAIA